MPAPNDPVPSAVNWNPPPALDVVQKAVEEEKMTDPAAIAAWGSKRYQMNLTAEEVKALLPQVLKPQSKQPRSH